MRGAGDQTIVWRGRLRDDDGRVWRAKALTARELTARWAPSKPGAAPVAALWSLRPVAIDVHAEAADGQSASRTVTRLVVGEGVRLRRWKDGLAATLCLPAEPAAGAVALVDATAGPEDATAAALAGPLLASRGVLALVVAGGDLDGARERLAAVPSAAGRAVEPVPALLPPGVGVQGADDAAGAERAAAWDALLARLGAVPR